MHGMWVSAYACTCEYRSVRSTLLRNSGEKLKGAGGGLGYTRILLLSKHKGIA